MTDDPAVGGAADPTTFAVGSAALTATKTAAGSFTSGSTVTYTIVISNSGSGGLGRQPRPRVHRHPAGAADARRGVGHLRHHGRRRATR